MTRATGIAGRTAAALRRRTLSRRVVWAVAIAFVLVGAVLTAKSFVEYRLAQTSGAALNALARWTIAGLDDAATEHDAATGMRALQRTIDESRRASAAAAGLVLEPLLMALVDARGRTIAGDPALAAATADPHAAAAPAITRRIGGRDYRTVRIDGPRWSLRLAEPALADSAALRAILSDLLPSILVAVPFVLLPVWLAVRTGLAPLRRLARRVRARAPDDLSPLAEGDLRHEELQTLATAFNHLLARLREHVRREREFVQDAAHELRTPMAVIAAQAHALALAADEAGRRDAGAALESAIARASHLASQLLSLATLDEPRPEPAAAFDVAAHLRQTLARAAPQALARGLELELDAPDALRARLAPVAWHSIVQNLVDNALRYVPAGGRVRIALGRAASGAIELRVDDDGPGIAPERHEAIFERFVRGDDAGQAAGTGLGLAIVRRAARTLGGEVTLGQGLGGRGAGFAVAVPG